MNLRTHAAVLFWGSSLKLQNSNINNPGSPNVAFPAVKERCNYRSSPRGRLPVKPLMQDTYIVLHVEIRLPNAPPLNSTSSLLVSPPPPGRSSKHLDSHDLRSRERD